MQATQNNTLRESLKSMVMDQLENVFEERARAEARRRIAWLLEEQERRRRMREEQARVEKQINSNTPIASMATTEETQMDKVREELLRRADGEKTKQMEAGEKLRRIVEDLICELKQKQMLPITGEEQRVHQQLSDKHEAVQEEMMSKFSLVSTRHAEEQERVRRIVENRVEDIQETARQEVDREVSQIYSSIVEEEERERRLEEDRELEMQESLTREALRRWTWMQEEEERRRRIVETHFVDLNEAFVKVIENAETRYLEELERARRIEEEERRAKSHQPDPNSDQREAIQEEFLSAVSRKESAKAEEAERTRRIETELQQEHLQSEMNRRTAYLLEESERRRRILEEVQQNCLDSIERQLIKFKVIELEEQERARRMRSEKTNSEPIHWSNEKEAVQRELIQQFDNAKTHLLEEQERIRRVLENEASNQLEEELSDFQSRANRVITKGLEEEERRRRIEEDLRVRVEQGIEREMDRRKCWLMEEQERRRRINEENSQQAIHLRQLLPAMNEQVKLKAFQRRQEKQ